MTVRRLLVKPISSDHPPPVTAPGWLQANKPNLSLNRVALNNFLAQNDDGNVQTPTQDVGKPQTWWLPNPKPQTRLLGKRDETQNGLWFTSMLNKIGAKRLCFEAFSESLAAHRC